jgi:hypothetical protein
MVFVFFMSPFEIGNKIYIGSDPNTRITGFVKSVSLFYTVINTSFNETVRSGLRRALCLLLLLACVHHPPPNEHVKLMCVSCVCRVSTVFLCLLCVCTMKTDEDPEPHVVQREDLQFGGIGWLCLRLGHPFPAVAGLRLFAGNVHRCAAV